MERIIVALVAGVVLPFSLATAHASMWRCGGGKIVATGDPPALVLARCGRPAYRQVLSGGRGSEGLVVEEWTYLQGPNQFIKILRFEGGRLVNIETGKRQ
jgi:hypothetical protein